MSLPPPIACLALLLAVFTSTAAPIAAAPDAAPKPTAREDAKPEPLENPLRGADDATRARAIKDAWTTYQGSCRPCHGSVGAGDGPYAITFAAPAADLRHPSRAIIADDIRFRRIRDGAASRSERPWESSMPAFGDDLDANQMWGLVLLLEQLAEPATGVGRDATGADVYESRCAVCHGTGGKGDGPLASELLPRPRDLVAANYRFRSTLSGGPPVDTDVLGTIAHGMGDSAMGRFQILGADRLEDVAAHLRTFAPERFAAPSETVPGSALPAEPVAQLAARGRQVYEDAKCGDCHGKTRRGDGPAAKDLKNDSGAPALATDLTKRWKLRGGSGAPGIFRTLSAGMDGTPMRSYLDTLPADQRWTVSYFLDRELRTRPRFPVTVQAGVVNEALPTDPGAPLWSTIPVTSIPLGPQIEVAPYWTQPSVDAVDVTVATNGKQIAILLAWNDRTRDTASDDAGATRTVAEALARRGSWRLPDRVAVQFPVKSDSQGVRPLLYMGDADHPVERWIWSADRFERGDTVVLVEQVAGARAVPTSRADGPAVTSAASFADGQWRVVLVGNLPPKSPASIPIAFQAWDGGAGEAKQWQSLSGWLTLNLR